jgi:hypothetical protein
MRDAGFISRIGAADATSSIRLTEEGEGGGTWPILVGFHCWEDILMPMKISVPSAAVNGRSGFGHCFRQPRLLNGSTSIGATPGKRRPA